MNKSERSPRPEAKKHGTSLRNVTHSRTGKEYHPCVYRLYDANDALLYIGVSVAMLSRLASHSQLPWFKEIAKVSIEHKETRDEAYIAEKLAIYDEMPKYNIINSGHYNYPSVKAARKREKEVKEMNTPFNVTRRDL